VQAEEVEQAAESEKEMVEPEPQRQPEPIKRKQPQVRPWDIGKEGELWLACVLLTFSAYTSVSVCSSIIYFNL
jgi:hypothetical protein